MSAILHEALSGALVDRYQEVRRQSVVLCEPLETEDYQVQPMDDASPPKWHLAHVSWFFETFLLKALAGYSSFHPAYEHLFNSYYNGVGQPYSRPKRGFLSRPTIDEIMAYRQHVDDHMVALLQDTLDEETQFKVVLGLNHEQQHQELILTDLKYNLGHNPLKPAYSTIAARDDPADNPGQMTWLEFEGGLVALGCDEMNSEHFVFDNETPRHQHYLQPFEIASRAVTNGEYLEFIEDDGYQRSELWLSDGWAHLNQLGHERWQSPLYWRHEHGEWFEYALTGERPLDMDKPVCHVSGYEAAAFATWKDARLPTESEWEHAVSDRSLVGNFVESKHFHPTVQTERGLAGMLGDVWEWTASNYSPYPGYKPFPGQLGEYNGKFMSNQLVLRGGSCATPQSHIRKTYRNFFYPPDRWQFSGIRLARDV